MCFGPQRGSLLDSRPEALRTYGACHILARKCASRHNRLYFCNISTSNSGLGLSATTACNFSTSQLPKVVRNCQCFTLLAWTRASRHIGVNFSDISTSKSGLKMLCFYVTTACNLSSLIWPAGSAPAALASLLVNPPEPQIMRKTQCFAAFLPFRAPAPSFF